MGILRSPSFEGGSLAHIEDSVHADHHQRSSLPEFASSRFHPVNLADDIDFLYGHVSDELRQGVFFGFQALYGLVLFWSSTAINTVEGRYLSGGQIESRLVLVRMPPPVGPWVLLVSCGRRCRGGGRNDEAEEKDTPPSHDRASGDSQYW